LCSGRRHEYANCERESDGWLCQLLQDADAAAAAAESDTDNASTNSSQIDFEVG